MKTPDSYVGPDHFVAKKVSAAKFRGTAAIVLFDPHHDVSRAAARWHAHLVACVEGQVLRFFVAGATVLNVGVGRQIKVMRPRENSTGPDSRSEIGNQSAGDVGETRRTIAEWSMDVAGCGPRCWGHQTGTSR